MSEYDVKQGDTLAKIAAAKRMPQKKIWDHPENKELREKRGDNQDILLPGDKLFIPDFEKKEESGATEKKHRFRVELPKRKLHLELVDAAGEPLKKHTYKLTIGSTVIEGDASKPIEEDLPFDEDTGELVVLDEDGDEVDRLDVKLDHVDPCEKDIETLTGVQARLNNLGYEAGAVDGKLGPNTKAAIREFQKDHDLDPTGKPEDISGKLKDVYGC